MSSGYLPETHRPLPAAIHHEKNLLCVMMNYPAKAIDEVVEFGISKEHFHHPCHAVVFEEMVIVHRKGLPIELISLISELEKGGKLELAGGHHGISEIYSSAIGVTDWMYYAQVVKAKWVARSTIMMCSKLVDAAYDPAQENDIPQIAQESLLGISSLYESHAKSQSWSEVIIEAATWIEKVNNGQIDPGLSTGLSRLDEAIMGLREEQMIVISAQTKVGKTTLALNIADHVAEQGHGVGIFSLEMSSLELGIKALSSESRQNLGRLAKGSLNQGAFRKISEAMHRQISRPIIVRDESVVSIAEFQAAARTLVQRDKCKLLLIDYLQLFSYKGTASERHRQVAESSQIIKQTARALKVPIIVMSQLNDDDRAAESKTIEKDANVFIIIEATPVLDEHGEETFNADGSPILEHWIWVKHVRHGAEVKFPVTFMKDHGRFYDRIPEPGQRPPSRRKGTKGRHRK